MKKVDILLCESRLVGSIPTLLIMSVDIYIIYGIIYYITTWRYDETGIHARFKI